MLFQSFVAFQIRGKFSPGQTDGLVIGKEFQSSDQGSGGGKSTTMDFIDDPQNAVNFDLMLRGDCPQCFVAGKQDRSRVTLSDGKSEAVV